MNTFIFQGGNSIVLQSSFIFCDIIHMGIAKMCLPCTDVFTRLRQTTDLTFAHPASDIVWACARCVPGSVLGPGL